MVKVPETDRPSDRVSLSVTASKVAPDIVLCVVLGEIDLSTEPMLRDTLPAASHLDPHHLVVDLSDVQYMGSVGLRVLVELHAAQQAAAHHLAIVTGANHSVTRPLQVTDLAHTFDLHVGLDTAVEACRRTASLHET